MNIFLKTIILSIILLQSNLLTSDNEYATKTSHLFIYPDFFITQLAKNIYRKEIINAKLNTIISQKNNESSFIKSCIHGMDVASNTDTKNEIIDLLSQKMKYGISSTLCFIGTLGTFVSPILTPNNQH